jgi:creatinine amidohydrolase
MRSVLLSELTSPDVKKAIGDGKLVIIPVGSTEQHGPHLPLDTDIVNAFEISKRAAENVGALVAPPLYYGISPHWMNFPGTMSIDERTFVAAVTQICNSLTRHGFKKIVILNGHGGNRSAIETIAQNVAEANAGKCLIAAFSYWDVSAQEIDALRESPYGGMGHACELETSLQLHLRSELVIMKRAVKNLQKRRSEFQPIDITDIRRGPLIYVAGGGGSSGEPGKPGVMGDPTIATREKGKKFFDAITGRVVKLLTELSETVV